MNLMRSLQIYVKRLSKLCVLEENIYQGNALQKRCLLDFSENYINTYDVTKINDLKYAQEYSEDKKEIKEKKLHKLTIDDLFNYM